MDFTVKNIKKVLKLKNIKDINFTLNELIVWTKVYNFEFKIIDNTFVRKDLVYKEDDLIRFSSKEFIKDWLITLQEKQEDFFFTLDENNKNDKREIENFTKLINSLKIINNKLESYSI